LELKKVYESGCAIGHHEWRSHMFEEKREAAMAIEAAVTSVCS
jgi:hypothetical protein